MPDVRRSPCKKTVCVQSTKPRSVNKTLLSIHLKYEIPRISAKWEDRSSTQTDGRTTIRPKVIFYSSCNNTPKMDLKYNVVLRCALPSACSVAYIKSTAVEAWNLTRSRLLKQNILQILEWLVKMYDVIVPKFSKITNRGLVDKRQNNRGPSVPRYKI